MRTARARYPRAPVADATASHPPLEPRADAAAPGGHTVAPDAEHPAEEADRLSVLGAAQWIRVPAAGRLRSAAVAARRDPPDSTGRLRRSGAALRAGSAAARCSGSRAPGTRRGADPAGGAGLHRAAAR